MRKLTIMGSIIAAFFLTSITVNAGEWSDDQKAVWSTVQAFWSVEQSKDADKLGSLISDDVTAWSKDLAMPRNKASTMDWFRFGFKQGAIVKYEITPVSIVVHGDAAIAHYYYVSVFDDKDGKRDNDNGRWSDTLVRDGDGWKFIGWQGGSDKTAD